MARGKELAFFEDVIFKHHPDFVNNATTQAMARRRPEMFSVTMLIEETLAHIGGYTFVNAAGYDFSDFSDSKTVTINTNTQRAEIGGVETKIGALRITAYNPVVDKVHFFFVGKDNLDSVRQPCYGKQDYAQRVCFTYSKRYCDSYGDFDLYRKNSFVDLAKAK